MSDAGTTQSAATGETVVQAVGPTARRLREIRLVSDLQWHLEALRRALSPINIPVTESAGGRLAEVLGPAGRPDATAGGGLVVVVDFLVPDLTRTVARSAAGEPGAPAVVVWGGYPHWRGAQMMQEAGVTGYAPLLAHADQFRATVLRAVEGIQSFPALEGAQERQLDFSRRELEVAEAYLVTYLHQSRREVAGRLGMAEETLKVHVRQIRARTPNGEVQTRAQLGRILLGMGVLGRRL